MFTFTVEGYDAADVLERVEGRGCVCAVVKVRSLEPEILGVNHSSIVCGIYLIPLCLSFFICKMGIKYNLPRRVDIRNE